ncbi:MAG TPA: hypothetical protein VII47_02575, partial [Actinomycetota bacterium]
GELTLDDGVALELRGARLVVDGGRQVTLRWGKVLVVAEGPVSVRSEPVTVRAAGGIFRVDRDDSTRVAVYKDEARIDGPSSLLSVPTYHESLVAGGVVPPSAQALQIDPSDRWDIRYLKDAIDIDARLANLSRGLEAQLGSGTGVDFYRRVLPEGFPLNLLGPMAADRKTDVLIGSLIAHEATARGTDEAAAVAGVFAMWREGASWGLVAHRFGVAQKELFSLLLDSVNRANLVDQGRGPGLASRRPSPGPPPTHPGTATPQPSEQPSATPQPSPGPSPGADVLKPVTDLLDQVVQGLLGGLLSPSPK